MRQGGHRAIALYDRVYRLWHGLDSPRADVPPILLVEIRRAYRVRRLSDGVVVRPGDRVAMLHLNNARVRALHAGGPSPMALGLEFRRDLTASLTRLAQLTGPGEPLADVAAVCAVTIFHRGLQRLGFEPDTLELAWPGFTGAYQRALVRVLHPAGVRRMLELASLRARRLWLSSERLRALFAPLPVGRPRRPGRSTRSRRDRPEPPPEVDVDSAISRTTI